MGPEIDKDTAEKVQIDSEHIRVFSVGRRRLVNQWRENGQQVGQETSGQLVAYARMNSN